MANEITALEQRVLPNGGHVLGLFFIYPIPVPAQVGGVNVVPTPYTNPIPTDPPLIPATVDAVITQPERDAFDTGDAAFAVVSFGDPTGAMTPAQMFVRAQEIYAASKAEFDVTYAARYQFTGQRGDA